MLDGFGRVLVLFLLLEIILLQVFNHLLTSWPKLTVELYHWHVLNDKIIGPTSLGVFLSLNILLVLGVGRCVVDLKLLHFKVSFVFLFQDVSLNRRLWQSTSIASEFLVSTGNKVMLVNHP